MPLSDAIPEPFGIALAPFRRPRVCDARDEPPAATHDRSHDQRAANTRRLLSVRSNVDLFASSRSRRIVSNPRSGDSRWTGRSPRLRRVSRPTTRAHCERGRHPDSVWCLQPRTPHAETRRCGWRSHRRRYRRAGRSVCLLKSTRNAGLWQMHRERPDGGNHLPDGAFAATSQEALSSRNPANNCAGAPSCVASPRTRPTVPENSRRFCCRHALARRNRELSVRRVHRRRCPVAPGRRLPARPPRFRRCSAWSMPLE